MLLLVRESGNHHHDEVDAGCVSSKDVSTEDWDVVEVVENVREPELDVLLRLCTDRRVSSEDWVSEEWLSTMGAGLCTSLDIDELKPVVGGDTGRGGDSELVGSVERVRLSRKGGGRLLGRKCFGGRRAGAGAFMGSDIASDSERRSGDGGVEEVEGVGDIHRRMGRRGMFFARASRRSASEGREEDMSRPDVTPVTRNNAASFCPAQRACPPGW